MNFPGISLLAGIISGNKSAGKARVQFAQNGQGIVRQSPNAPVTLADGSIGRFSISRDELASLAQSQAVDPIGAIINSNWRGVGATSVS